MCPWQIQVPDNADGTKDSYFPMHVGRDGKGERGKGGRKRRGMMGEEKREGRGGKKERRAKVVADCETLEYGDGIADIEERPVEPVQRKKEREGERKMGGGG